MIGCNCNSYVVKSGAKQSGTNLNIHMDVDFGLIDTIRFDKTLFNKLHKKIERACLIIGQ